MKPDRFTKMAYIAVQHVMGAEAFDLTAASSEMVRGAEAIVSTLLRSQFAQVRRVVDKLPRHGFDEMISPTELRKALDAYKWGTK